MGPMCISQYAVPWVQQPQRASPPHVYVRRDIPKGRYAVTTTQLVP